MSVGLLFSLLVALVIVVAVTNKAIEMVLRPMRMFVAYRGSKKGELHRPLRSLLILLSVVFVAMVAAACYPYVSGHIGEEPGLIVLALLCCWYSLPYPSKEFKDILVLSNQEDQNWQTGLYCLSLMTAIGSFLGLALYQPLPVRWLADFGVKSWAWVESVNWLHNIVYFYASAMVVFGLFALLALIIGISFYLSKRMSVASP